jgi:hypothetical protein
MAKFLLFAAFVFLCFSACGPLYLMTPHVEVIEVVLSDADYVIVPADAGSVEAALIEHEAIKLDREIEVYWHPYYGNYWGMLIDVDLLIPPEGGRIYLYDPLTPRKYVGCTVRVIVTWYIEEPYVIEEP